MRVTDRMRFEGGLPHYRSLMARQVDLRSQIAGGKRILRVSDDVAGAAKAQSYRRFLSAADQYGRTMDDGMAWTEVSGDALDGAVSQLQRARELAVQAADPILSASDRGSIAQELERIVETMVALGSQTLGGRSVFAGTQTDAPAFSAVVDASGKIVAVTYNGDGGAREVEIAPGRTVPENVLGSNEAGGNFGAFRDTVAGVDAFGVLIQLRGFVEAGNLASISAVSMPGLDAALDHLAEAQARLGGVQNRILAAQVLNEDVSDSTTQSLSKVEDTDIAAAATELGQLGAAYEAALAVGARIAQVSLLNFLR